MVLARWQATIVDDAGDVQSAASVEVRHETGGAPLAVIYSDRAGATPISNPLTADADGFAAFHVPGGAYKITATKGAFSREWRYVGIGLSSESDAPIVDVSYAFSSTTTDADPGDGIFQFNNATLASVTTVYIDLLDDLGSDMTTWLDRLDDAGSTTDRGQLTIRTVDGSAEFVAKITGSITTATGYRKITVSYLTSSGAFIDGARATITFAPRGQNGTGDVVGPASATDADIALFDTTTGKLLKDGGKTLTTVATGKQTIWIPASAITKSNGSTGPSDIEVSIVNGLFHGLAYDPTSDENTWFMVAMPQSWDAGNISFQVYWMHPATTTNFATVWTLFAAAFGDNEAFTGAGLAGSIIVDTGGTTNNVYISPESSVFAVGSSPAKSNLVNFLFQRSAGNGSDTLAVDAYLIGIKIFYTTNANTDA